MEKANFDLDPMMGKKIKDIVTGFEGIVTGVVQSLTGCKQYVVKPKVDKEGKASDGVIIDEGRAKVLGQGIRPKSIIKKQSGKRGACEVPSNIGKLI